MYTKTILSDWATRRRVESGLKSIAVTTYALVAYNDEEGGRRAREEGGGRRRTGGRK